VGAAGDGRWPQAQMSRPHTTAVSEIANRRSHHILSGLVIRIPSPHECFGSWNPRLYFQKR
jgi:hypothetical protein